VTSEKRLGPFRLAPGALEAAKLRRPETRDMAERLGVLPPERIHLTNYPVGRPLAAFNASAVVEGDEARVYARIIVGYYLYVSAVAEIRVPLEDILYGGVNLHHYAARVVVHPSTKYDIWGVEDPRVFRLDGILHMVYTGRTVNYFNPSIRRERTLPVVAVREGEEWAKKAVLVLPAELRRQVVSDKDAFLVKVNGDLLLFHRPHMSDEKFYLTVSRLPEPPYKCKVDSGKLCELEVEDTTVVMVEAGFESKIGWSTPPIMLDKSTLLTFIHGVDAEMGAYRLFAAVLEYDGSEVRVQAVTPHYIMEPKIMPEVFGDRPFTIFPCGADRLPDGRILVTYGAADYMVGLAAFNLSEILESMRPVTGTP
jgi:predicted GH43/DUF377 family glycosyl hydrolase